MGLVQGCPGRPAADTTATGGEAGSNPARYAGGTWEARSLPPRESTPQGAPKGRRGKEDGGSDGRPGTGRRGVAPPGARSPCESKPTSLWSLITRACGARTEGGTHRTADTTERGDTAPHPAAGAPAHDPEGWHAIAWPAASHTVRRLQARLVQATQAGSGGQVTALQHLLPHSCSGKARAVKRVTDNQGQHPPGVDRDIGDTPEKQMEAVLALRQRGSRPRPRRRGLMPKRNGTQRPRGIPMCPAYCLSLPRRLGMSIARTIAVGWKHQPTQYTGSGSTGTSPTTPVPPSAVAPGASLAPSAASPRTVSTLYPPSAARSTAQEQQRSYARFSDPSFCFYTTKNISVAFYTHVGSLRDPVISSWPPEVLPPGGGWPGPPEPSLHPGPMPRLALADGLA